MYIRGTYISCGVVELVDIGNSPRQDDFDPILRYECKGSCALIIASLTSQQKNAGKFLLKNKFKKVGKWVKNPNSGNKIALFVREVSQKRKRRSK